MTNSHTTEAEKKLHSEQAAGDGRVAFQHIDVPIYDAVIGAHRAGFVEEVADVKSRPGAVLPPPPSRPAPKEPLSARLREMIERG